MLLISPVLEIIKDQSGFHFFASSEAVLFAVGRGHEGFSRTGCSRATFGRVRLRIALLRRAAHRDCLPLFDDPQAITLGDFLHRIFCPVSAPLDTSGFWAIFILCLTAKTHWKIPSPFRFRMPPVFSGNAEFSPLSEKARASSRHSYDGA